MSADAGLLVNSTVKINDIRNVKTVYKEATNVIPFCY